MLMPEEVTIGSLLWRRDLKTGAVFHFGAVRAFNQVVHVDKAETRHLRFNTEDLATFAAGKEVQIELAPAGIDSSTIDARVRQLHSQQQMYNLFGRNCEHAARFFATGVAISKQVDNAVKAAGVIGSVALLLHLASKD
jgi:hypothetical protein